VKRVSKKLRKTEIEVNINNTNIINKTLEEAEEETKKSRPRRRTATRGKRK
jgi:hypothetical protein